MLLTKNKNLLILSRGHHAGLLFCWRIRQGLKREGILLRIKKYIAYFWKSYFEPLFKAESRYLLLVVNDATSRIALAQQQEIKKIIQQIIQNTALPEKTMFNHLADVVNEHIRFEENVLFPHAEQVLSKVQLDEMGTYFRSLNVQSFKDNYPDDFWVKPDYCMKCLPGFPVR